MVFGSVVFARLRRASLPVLLFFSTVAIGAGYLGMAAAPMLAVACVASAVGGLGNGIQWVAVISAVQELTAPLDAGPRARHARILRLGDARPRLRARRADNHVHGARERHSSSPARA